MSNSLLDSALAYERLSFFVIPADPVEKKPVVKWAHRRDKRPTPDEIRSWFDRFPDARIAIATGVYSGFDVVDVDSPRALEQLRMICGGLPETITQDSGREGGGRHFLFKHSEHGLKAHGDGFIDLRTTNDIVIVAPSRHKSGRCYAWGKFNPIQHGLEALAEWPPKLIAYFRGLSRAQGTSESGALRRGVSLAPVPRGERHSALCRTVGAWISQGLTDETIRLAAQGWYLNLPDKEGFSEKELEDQVQDLVDRYRQTNNQRVPGEGRDQEKEKQADALVRIGKSADLFKVTDGTSWARFPVNGHLECWPIRSKGSGFRQWLVRQFVHEAGTAPSITAIQAAIEVLEAEARFGPASTTREVFTRVAGYDGAVYLDLADPAWRAIKVTATEWSVDSTPPVCFRRTRGMQALPEPIRGGDLRLLDNLVNLGHPENRLLILSWLVYCLNPCGPYPVLCFISEQGSGKSATAKMLRMAIDPNQAPTRAMPKSLEDLAVAAQHSWVLNFDNLSFISDEFSDALCRLATGGGFATRSLYTNDEETAFWAKRPIILNGISEFAGRPDLLERALLVRLPSIPREKRRTESVIFAEFESVRAALLGAILNAAVLALKNKGAVRIPQCPRMADFAEWTAAASPAFSVTPDQMMALLLQNQQEVMLSELDAPLPQAVFELLEKEAGGFEGLLRDLLAKLGDLAGEEAVRQKNWPVSSKALRNALARLSPVMRVAGVVFQELKKTNKGRMVRLARQDVGDGTGLRSDGCDAGVTISGGYRHGLSPRSGTRCCKNAPKSDGSDDLPPSLSVDENRWGEREGEREREAKPPPLPSQPSLDGFPSLLEGEL
jgi:hypothetical protein